MQGNYNNNTITIIFSGVIQESSGQKITKKIIITANPNETVKTLLKRFFNTTKLSQNSYKFKFSKKNLASYEEWTLAQMGLVNNSVIELTYIQLECGEGNNPNIINNPELTKNKGNEYDDNNNINNNPNNINNENYNNNEIQNQQNEINGYINNISLNEVQPRGENEIQNNDNNNNRIPDNLINPLNYDISIKFIKYSAHSAYECDTQLKGILKLCYLNEMASKINDDILYDLYKYNNIPEIVYFILKILKKNYEEYKDKKEAPELIKKVLGKKGCNVINFSNFVEEQIDQDMLELITNFVPLNYLSDINDTKRRLGKYSNYMPFFEKVLKESLKNSVFEFSPISLVVLDREDFDKFKKEKANCPNLRQTILYHGTSEDPISKILTGMFRRSEKSGYQHGKGVYFTDSLDYCYFYGSPKGNRVNMNKIPHVGELFTAICSLVYYDKNGFLQVKDHKTRLIPGKNEVNFAYAASTTETLLKDDPKKFCGTEYVIYTLEQICPLISVKFKRDEFCFIWHDPNFSEDPIYGGITDEKFKNYLKERIRYINQMAKFNVYTFINKEDALKCVNRKKYNRIILISNVGQDLGGRAFVDEARQIIGSNSIVLFSSYDKEHLEWITKYKNALFSNDPKLTEEFLESFSDTSKINGLIEKFNNAYSQYYGRFDFDNNFLKFPHYKAKGKYSDLSF